MRKEPTRILIVRLSALGDVIQTLPVLDAVRQRYPKATIGWLVESGAAHLLKDHPMIDKVHVADRRNWQQELRNPFTASSALKQAWTFVESIRKVDYEVAIDTQGLLKSAIWPFLAGIPKRIGFTPAREKAHLFYSSKIPDIADEFDPAVPLYEHMLELVRQIDCPAETPSYPLAYVTQGERHRVKRMLQVLPQGKPSVVLAPATLWDSKHWPRQHWSDLLKLLLTQTDFNLIMVGGETDGALCHAIVEDIEPGLLKGRFLNLCGKTLLKELQYVFSKVDYVVGSDSFPLHLAGAVGHPTPVALFGPTSYRRTGPPRAAGVEPVLFHTLQAENQLPCQPCHERQCPLGTTECMVRLTPELVFESIRHHSENRPDTENVG